MLCVGLTWIVLGGCSAEALKPSGWSPSASLSPSLLHSPGSSTGGGGHDGEDMDPLLLSRKLAKTRKQFARVAHALVKEDLFAQLTSYRKYLRLGQSVRAEQAWRGVSEYLAAQGFSRDAIQSVQAWASNVKRAQAKERRAGAKAASQRSSQDGLEQLERLEVRPTPPLLAAYFPVLSSQTK